MLGVLMARPFALTVGGLAMFEGLGFRALV